VGATTLLVLDGRTNWFEGKLGDAISPQLREFMSAEGRFIVPGTVARDSEVMQFCVRPERLRILPADEPVGDGLNLVFGTLVSAVYLGSEIHLAVALDSGRTIVCVEQNRDQTLPPAGTRIRLAFRPMDCILTD
jgi:hypothetical protein